jgi:pimeloyl-ACP methyl ester carboxylesterase
MPKTLNVNRRRFFGAAAMSIAATQLGSFPSASAQSSDAAPQGQGHTSFALLKHVDAGLLNVGYAEAGPSTGYPVILLHGWPYDIHSFVDVAPILAAAGYRVIVPYLRGYGSTTFLSRETFRNGQQSVVAIDIIALMDALKIRRAILGGFDWGARTVDIIAALWPERCKGIVSVSGYLIGNPAANSKPSPPAAEYAFWYQYYFATKTGLEGYRKNLLAFNHLIWRTASPKWNFSETTYERTAASFSNPDHVAIVIHNYRWRIGVAKGEPKYDHLEARLAEGLVISVPAITMEGAANGAAHPPAAAYRGKFSGKYDYRLLAGDIGHNLPQEAPQAFAQAIIDVNAFS